MTGLGADILTSPLIAKACAPTSSLVFDVPSMQITRFFPGFLLNEHLHDVLYRTLVKLAKLCEEELDGQHPNIGHESKRVTNPLLRQGIIAL